MKKLKKTIIDELKEYFENTPKDKIKKDWKESCEKVKGVKSPTIAEFLNAQKR
jgi:hypothetical protein